jgi:hypothetical protein
MRRLLLALSALLCASHAYADEAMRTAGADSKPFEVAQWLAPGAPIMGLSGFRPLSGTVSGTPTSILISSAQATSPTDYTPASQFYAGWTWDVTTQGVTPAGAQGTTGLGNYALGTTPGPASNLLQITDTRPTYTCTTSGCTPGTEADTIYAIGGLRQVYPNGLVPTESGSTNAVVTLVASDWVYQGDVLSAGTGLPNWYTGGNSVATIAATGIPISTGSITLPVYPPPIFAWVTEPGLRYDGTSTITLEGFCGHARGQGGKSCAGVTYTMTDGTHSVSHTAPTPTASTRQYSALCTGTTGSSILTGCNHTDGFIVGQRLGVPGIKGQAKLLSKTSTTLTFGQSTAGTATAMGAETITATPGNGEAYADGAFAGATLTDTTGLGGTVNIVAPSGLATSSSTASTTITLGAPTQGQWALGEWLTSATCLAPSSVSNAAYYIKTPGTGTGGAGTYILNANPLSVCNTGTETITGSPIGPSNGTTGGGGIAAVTQVVISTSAVSGTVGSHAIVINHVFQATTGPVTVTAGDPIPVYAVNFVSSDFSTLTDGVIWFTAVACPNVGVACFTTQAGAGGDDNGGIFTANCDWFWNNPGTTGAGTCNASNSAWWGSNNAASATVISPNVHNLSASKDAALTYPTKYAWVSGTAGASPAVQATSADPGSTAYYATDFAAVTALKAAYGGTGANGGVVCDLAAGSPYSGFGGIVSGLTLSNKPPLTFTSAKSGSACPATGPLGADITVQRTHGTQNGVASNWHFNNFTVTGTATVFQGNDTAEPNSFEITEAVFDDDYFLPTGAGSALLYRIGTSSIYNSYIDQTAGESSILTHNGSISSFARLVVGSTIVGGSSWIAWADLGNIAFNAVTAYDFGNWVLQANSTLTYSFAAQPMSAIVAYNKFMALNKSNALLFGNGNFGSRVLNLYDDENICEGIKNFTMSCMQIMADSTSANSYNFVSNYHDMLSGRTNIAYDEDINGAFAGATSVAGSLTTEADYRVLVTFGAPGGAATETSAVYPVPTLNVTGSSIVITTPPLNGRLVWIYGCSPTVNPSCLDGNGNPTTLLSATGAGNSDLAGVPTGASYIAKYIGAARTVPSNLTQLNVWPQQYMMRFDVDLQINMKSDYYATTQALASGGKMGNFDSRFGVGRIGNVVVAGSSIGGCNSTTSLYQPPACGSGDYVGYLTRINQTNNGSGSIGFVGYSDNRSTGGNSTSVPTYPATNIGEGNYCNSSSSNVGGRVPAGSAADPWDISGTPRKNDGTGYAGAYEAGCPQ